jgi:anterior pharynx defective protein 1
MQLHINNNFMVRRAEKGLHTTAKRPTSRLNRSSFALGKHGYHSCSSYSNDVLLLASGLGFGLIYALTTYISLLSQSLGPGSPMAPTCPTISIFFLSGKDDY